MQVWRGVAEGICTNARQVGTLEEELVDLIQDACGEGKVVARYVGYGATDVGDVAQGEYEGKWAVVRIKGAKVSRGGHASHCIGCFFDGRRVTFYEPLSDARTAMVKEGAKRLPIPLRSLLNVLGNPPYDVLHGEQEFKEKDCVFRTCEYVLRESLS